MQQQSIDVFRMAALRAPQLATSNFRRIAIRDDGVSYGVDGSSPITVQVNGNLTLDRIDHPWLEDQPKLVSFNQWLTPARDIAAPDEIGRWYKKSAGLSLDALVSEAWFDEAERVVHASFLYYLAKQPDHSNAMMVSRARHDLLRAARLIGIIRELARPQTELTTGEQVARFLATSAIVLPWWFYRPLDRLARPPLIADLKVVKLGNAVYLPRGIVYVENVMIGEKRAREIRRTEEIETTQTDETEKTTDSLDELTTTVASELAQEVSNTLHEQEQLEVGANVSAQYGPYVKVDASAKYGRESARNEASRAAATFSNQVMKRASERVVERQFSRRTTRRLWRTEETNSHSFENPLTENNAVGIYRTLETEQEAWIENYGCRMMLEFMIPEPAAFVRWVEAQPQPGKFELRDEPKLPQVDSQALTADLISEDNYVSLLAQVRATGITPPPPPSIVLGKTPKGASDNTDLFVVDDSSLIVPDGFQAAAWEVAMAMWGAGSPDGEVTMVSVGGGEPTVLRTDAGLARTASGTLDMQEKSVVPVIFLGRGLINFDASVTITCNRTSEALMRWRIKVFDAIVLAWRKDRDEWLAEKSKLESDHALAEIAAVGTARGQEQNREIERRELRRGVLTFLLGDPLDKGVFAQPAVRVDPKGGPSIDFDVALMEADWIAFLEQSFEWPNMTWVHYPYYWADQARWKSDVLNSGTDPMWNAFLTSGSSRVVVPVRPGFESAMCLFLTTGIIWDGGDAPTAGDPMYVGIAEELAESLGASTPEVLDRQDLQPVRMPTSLVWLQPTGDLNPGA